MTHGERIARSLQRLRGLIARRPGRAGSGGTTVARSVDGLRCRIEDGVWRFEIDQPRSLGGGGRAGDPGVFGRAALAGCLVQSYMMWFAMRRIPFDGIEVEVRSESDLRGILGVDDGVPPGYGEVCYLVRIESPAPAAEVERAIDEAERHSPWHYNFVTPLKLTRRLEIRRGTPA